MKTTKPFSTISYNSQEFLTNKLDTLVFQGDIDFYAFIHHLPEEDEKKEHKHLYVVPNGRIDTDQVRKFLEEIDPLSPFGKPLGCIACKSSKFADWYLYGCHDVQYLASKGQSRKYHYSFDDFVVSDDDYFIEEYHQIDYSKFKGIRSLVEAVDCGIPFDTLVRNGQVPLQQFVGYQKAYDILSHANYTNRGDFIGHDEIINEDGEIEYSPVEKMQFDIAFQNAKNEPKS